MSAATSREAIGSARWKPVTTMIARAIRVPMKAYRSVRMCWKLPSTAMRRSVIAGRLARARPRRPRRRSRRHVRATTRPPGDGARTRRRRTSRARRRLSRPDLEGRDEHIPPQRLLSRANARLDQAARRHDLVNTTYEAAAPNRLAYQSRGGPDRIIIASAIDAGTATTRAPSVSAPHRHRCDSRSPSGPRRPTRT